MALNTMNDPNAAAYIERTLRYLPECIKDGEPGWYYYSDLSWRISTEIQHAIGVEKMLVKNHGRNMIKKTDFVLAVQLAYKNKAKLEKTMDTTTTDWSAKLKNNFRKQAVIAGEIHYPVNLAVAVIPVKYWGAIADQAIRMNAKQAEELGIKAGRYIAAKEVEKLWDSLQPMEEKVPLITGVGFPESWESFLKKVKSLKRPDTSEVLVAFAKTLLPKEAYRFITYRSYDRDFMGSTCSVITLKELKLAREEYLAYQAAEKTKEAPKVEKVVNPARC